MSDKKIISFKKFQYLRSLKKLKEKTNMLFLVIVSGILIGLLVWQLFVENVANLDVKIPESENITFNDRIPEAMTTSQVANLFDNSEGKPILLYIYTTWCKICSKNFLNINEVAREFQNTDLEFIAIAIDKDLASESLQKYLNKFGNLYFEPRFLAFKEGFLDFLDKRKIRYNNRIPFTALISAEGEVSTKFVGTKRKNHLRNRIIKELYGLN